VDLLRPGDTRWNSKCDALQRLARLRPFVNIIRPAADDKWAAVSAALELLTPVAAATDVVQKDDATLHDVFETFTKVRRFFDERQLHMTFGEHAAAMHDRWDRQFHSWVVDALGLLHPRTDVLSPWTQTSAAVWWTNSTDTGPQYWPSGGQTRRRCWSSWV